VGGDLRSWANSNEVVDAQQKLTRAGNALYFLMDERK